MPDDISIEYTVKGLRQFADEAEAVHKKDHAQYWNAAADMIEALRAEIKRLHEEIWDWKEGVNQS